MILIGLSVDFGYSLIILIFIQILLFPLILMVTQLYDGVIRIGTYIAARTEASGFTNKLPWEYMGVNRYQKIKGVGFFNISSHVWLLFIPTLVSFIYLIISVVFSNSFIKVIGENITWDFDLATSNYLIKLILLFLSSFLFIINTYSCYKYEKIDKLKLHYFEEHKKELTKLHVSARAKMVDCPRCGGTAEATGREFKFGVFDGKQFRCQTCEKNFNAFYRAGNLKYTVPKATK